MNQNYFQEAMRTLEGILSDRDLNPPFMAEVGERIEYAIICLKEVAGTYGIEYSIGEENPDTICQCGWRGPESALRIGVKVGEEYSQRHCPQCDYCFGTYRNDPK